MRGHRCAFVVVNVSEGSDIPEYAEPWFLMFQADVDIYPVMNSDDLVNSGLDKIAKAVAANEKQFQHDGGGR